MRLILYFVICFTIQVSAQIKGTTPAGRLIPKKEIKTVDVDKPEIKLIEPFINTATGLTVREAFQTIILEVNDKSGIASVKVNNEEANMLENQKYFMNASLRDGSNPFVVIAVDIYGNIGRLDFSINYSSDSEPPFVNIVEPTVSRGVKIVSKKEVLTVKGNAYDESGVKSLTVNGRRANIEPNGNFTIDINLIVGDNPIIVRAVDNKDNAGIDTFIINRKLEDLITVGNYYALIIGIDNYKGSWTKLRNAVNDAKAVEKLISTEYQFDKIISMYNEDATRSNIITQLEWLTTNIKKEDNVLIFYSGHGEFKQNLNKGYWVPVDATTTSTAGYISNSDIQTFLNGINSKHTLLISDACFSGDIFRGRTEETPFEDSERYYKEVYRKPSRYALTSGGVEPVTDGGRDGHSVFTYYLLNKLRDNNSKYFTAGQLFNELHIPVTNNSEQSPVYQPIKNTGDEGGQFIFIKKK